MQQGPETICDLGAGVPKRSELEPNHGVVEGGAADPGDCGWCGRISGMTAFPCQPVFPASTLPQVGCEPWGRASRRVTESHGAKDMPGPCLFAGLLAHGDHFESPIAQN